MPVLNFLTFLVIILVLLSVLLIAYSLKERERKKQELKERLEQLDELAKNTIAVTPEEFFELRKQRGTNRVTQADFTGVYVLHNKTKEMYYVGQGKSVISRVNAHFTGKGNGDVYADYKYGDEFEIATISLLNSGYASLDALEKDMIDYFDAYNSGYNRTRGNN